MTTGDRPPGWAGSLARDPRAEVQALGGDAYQARGLEPSPPAVVDDGDQFADDPVAGPGDGRPVVGSVVGPVASAEVPSDFDAAPAGAHWDAGHFKGALLADGDLVAG